ncbi:hypothetical protein C8J56DRAFT_1113465 [Mycena floridula]|nr:hypothetical protein C8J56DRAFT_1113465 [Mycena floridula]
MALVIPHIVDDSFEAETASELLVEIMHHTIDPDYDPLDISAGPWVFTHVSSACRYLASTTPSLWKNMFIPSSPGSVRSDGALEMFRVCLERTKPCTFSLRFEGRSTSQYLLTRGLSKHLHRLETLYLDVPQSVLNRLEKDFNIFPLLRLRTATVASTSSSESLSEPLPFLPDTLFRKARNLNQLALLGVEFVEPLEHTLPWDSLTSINLVNTEIGRQEQVDILSMADNLVDFDVVEDDLDFCSAALIYLDWTPVHFKHATLQSLHISDIAVLDNLSLPALQSLTIDNPAEFPITSDKFQQLHVPALISLALNDVILSSDFASCIRGLPMLQDLGITNSQFWDEDCAMFLCDIVRDIAGPSPTMPNLSAIEIKFFDPEDGSESGIFPTVPALLASSFGRMLGEEIIVEAPERKQKCDLALEFGNLDPSLKSQVWMEKWDRAGIYIYLAAIKIN